MSQAITNDASPQSSLPSGIEPLDTLLGALVPGRIHVLCGSTGTGKSVAALQFVNAAITGGSTALLLTQEDAADVTAMGRYLGMRLADAARSGRLTVLRCRADFARRYRQLPSPEPVFDELRALAGWRMPDRIAIDSIAAFLEISSSSGAPLGALGRWLEGTGATSLVTVPGDVSRVDDLRVDALLQRAVAVARLNSHAERGRRMEVIKTRFSGASRAPVEFRIESGRGIVMGSDTLRLAPRASA